MAVMPGNDAIILAPAGEKYYRFVQHARKSRNSRACAKQAAVVSAILQIPLQPPAASEQREPRKTLIPPLKRQEGMVSAMKWIDSLNERSSHKEHIWGIHCDVANCTFHDPNGKCSANQIRVGPAYADNSTDTVCSTFKQNGVQQSE